MKVYKAGLILLAFSVCATARQLLSSQRALSFTVSIGSGPDATIRRAYVAYSPLDNATYSVAQVQDGTVALGGKSLTVSRAGGTPVQSMFVYRLKAGTVSEAEWAVNLQAGSEHAETFYITAVAANPATGDLFLVGTYAGLLNIGPFNLTSSGGFDIFVAGVSAKDGRVLWANSFGGAVGSDAATDLAFNPSTGEVLVGGTFSKNALFGPNHAVTASVNNVMQSEGIFVAALTAAEGAVNWVSSFPSDSQSISSVKLAVSDALYVGAAALGPSTVHVNDAKLSIPATGAGAVLVKLSFDGQLDVSTPPATVVSVSNGIPAFTLSALGASPSSSGVFLACSFVGKLLVDGATVSQAVGPHSNAAIVRMNDALHPVWFTSLAGSGASTADSIAVVPSESSLFVSGNAWSPDGVVATAATPTEVIASSLFRDPAGSAEGAFLLQLSGATGAPVWMRIFQGYQEQASQVCYAWGGYSTSQILLTGLFDRGSRCLALNSRDSQCAVGTRPYFLASIPVSPTDTAAVERELESKAEASEGSSDGGSSLSGGAIAGAVIGSVAGAIMLAAGGCFVYKRRQAARSAGECGGREEYGIYSTTQGTNAIHNPLYNGVPTATVTTSSPLKPPPVTS